MRHLLTTKEFNKEELLALIALGRAMKADPAAFRTSLAGKSVVAMQGMSPTRARSAGTSSVIPRSR